MPEATDPPIKNKPLKVQPADRVVVIDVPGDGEVTLTAHAAEVSAIRLLDAADRSRKRF